MIFHYSDGTWATYQDPRNGHDSLGYYSCFPTSITISNGYWYYKEGGSNSPIVSVGHTHVYGSSPNAPDYFYVPPGVTRFIYYQAGMYYY